MELLLLNKNRIKIILDCKDLKDYGICIDRFDYSETETRKAIWEIFDRAKAETGFDAASDKIYIQVFPTQEGGLELLATKICIKEKKHDKKISERFVYSFSSYEDLSCALILAKGRGIFGDSSLFFDESKKVFYLALDFCNDILLDYSVQVKDAYAFEFISEHCKELIKENAVERIVLNKNV